MILIPGGGNPNPNPNPPVTEDDSWTDTKADCVKEKLEAGGSNSILNKLLEGFNLSTSTINLTFYVGNTDYRGNPVPNGKCIFDPNTDRMYVYVSEDRLNESSLEIARTILHECFHAYIYGKLYGEDIHNGLAPEPDFAKDFAEYEKKYKISDEDNESQHNYTADKYRTYMKEGLKTYFEADPKYSRLMDFFSDDPNWHGVDYMYESLTWGGLKKTDAWKEYIKTPGNEQKLKDQKQFIYRYLPKENCE
ncbi:hypothetical protein ACT3CE_04280 [Marinifilum sp. RC60d5]|uniref:hypothetical protein n=1 Tax=Marinifilum sp. RC60d5 TaxID=3458414 RepID=UPI004036819E